MHCLCFIAIGFENMHRFFFDILANISGPGAYFLYPFFGWEHELKLVVLSVMSPINGTILFSIIRGLQIFYPLFSLSTLTPYPSHLRTDLSMLLRGGIIIKKGKIFEFFQNIGGWGGSKTKQKSLRFKFGHLKTHGGFLIFQKCLNYKLLLDPILKKKNQNT